MPYCKEFHNAQDTATTIMDNDSKDLQTIIDISDMDLIEDVTSPELSEAGERSKTVKSYRGKIKKFNAIFANEKQLFE